MTPRIPPRTPGQSDGDRIAQLLRPVTGPEMAAAFRTELPVSCRLAVRRALRPEAGAR